jgi:hypothetical protein
MPSLREIQSTFGAALIGGAERDILPWIAAAGVDPARRLSIYRNNVFSNYRSTLRQVFPVVERLVGEEFFRRTADYYIARCPSSCGDLNRYGERFPEFLAGYHPAAALRYLPDVARLEWLIEESFQAADHPPLGIERISRIDPQDYLGLRFRLHPACRLFHSPYPVRRIWHVNQPDWRGEPDVDLSEHADWLLVRRDGFEVRIEPLPPAEFLLLAALSRGEPLGAALEATSDGDADVDLGDVIARHVAGQTIVDVVASPRVESLSKL